MLLLDVVEHLSDPEQFVEQLREALKFLPDVKLMVATPAILDSCSHGFRFC